MIANTAEITAEIGHNAPPEDAFISNLQERNADLLADTESMLDDAALAPDNVETEEQSKQLTELVKKINAMGKLVEEARVIEKEPYLEGSRKVDEFFRKPYADLMAAAVAAKRKITAFLDRKEAERLAQLRAEEERKRKEAEAEKERARQLEQAGRANEAKLAESNAAKIEKQADKIEAKAEAGTGGAKTIGAHGTASLRKTWTGTITDRDALDLNALRPFLSDDTLQKAVNAFVKNGGRALAGAVIAEKSETVVR